jgi:hypothetical protein
VPLGIGPGPRSHAMEDRALGLGPERARDGKCPSTLRGGSHGLDPGVGVRDALDHAISLEPIEAARQGRLVDRELVFELFQIRVARRTPQGIRRGHLPHNGGDLGIDARTASSRPTRELGPVLAEASALPS